ncbi:ABC-type sugar transport system permease subunit/ABC-type glycerol-3-phosphate transport system substrate-binding protein [Bradyrhizobium sp. LM3.6]
MKNASRASSLTRRKLLKASAATAALAAFPAPLIAQTKPFAGVTLHGASFQHRFFTLLQKYIPEFEEQTGMKVDLQLSAFPVYNQQANLELSSGGSAYDFVNVTFILAARWVAAGLLADLNEFTGDPNLTPAEWNPKDFVEGAQVPYRDAKGGTYGYSWEGGAMLMGLSRMDLMEKKGLKIPKTFAELQQVCAEINGTDGVSGITSFQLHHWNLPPYIQGFGGDIFRKPPGDIMPALNTPETIQGIEFYANLLKNAPKGVLTYTEDQARQSLLTGRSNIFIHSSSWVTPILLSDESKVKETSRVVRSPAGPVHDYPASNSQGLGIPKNAKEQEGRVGIHQMGALARHLDAAGEGARSFLGVPALDHHQRGLSQAQHGERPGPRRALSRSAGAAGQGRELHGLSHREGISDRRRRPQQGVRAGRNRPAARKGRDERGAGPGYRRTAPFRDAALSESGIDGERRRFIAFALTPSLIVLFAIAVLPAIYLVVTSLTPFQLTMPGSATDFSAPLRNYGLLPGDPRFVNSLWVQAKLSCWGVLFQVLFGMLLALLLNVPSRLVEFARTFFLIPMVLPPIVVAVIWKLIYTPDISPLYYAAQALHFTMPALTSSVDFALTAIIIADTWEWLPFTFLMVLAALQTIPDEYSEAALVDGASTLQIFWYVTLPFIMPILVISGMFRLIDSVKAFPLIFLLTSGGPGTVTEVTNYYAYLLAFDTNEIGYSSAVTVVMLLLVAGVSLGLVWMGRRREAMA